MKTHMIARFIVAAFALALAGNASAQSPAPASALPKTESKEPDLGSMNVSICYEAFSLPIAKAGELQRKGMTDEELYKEVVSTGKLERMLVLRTKSGQRAVVENVTSYIFPTEFTQPQIPCGNPGNVNVPTPLPVAPTAFDKKEVGDTLEGEPTLSQNAKFVDFQIAVSHVALARREKWGQGITELEQPQFESQKLNTNFTASVGSPLLIGTLNPVFGNGLAARAEQNVWFCFITTTLAKNNATSLKKSGH